MARCKECIHSDVCDMWAVTSGIPFVNSDTCEHFIATADVVPKSEVERLEHILDCYALQYGTVTEQQEVIDKAKSEVARGIFEEIESLHLHITNEFDLRRYNKLKKKYTEDQSGG